MSVSVPVWVNAKPNVTFPVKLNEASRAPVPSRRAIATTLPSVVSALPASTRPSFEAGALNLFYFLYQLVSDEREPPLTHELLTRTARWNFIRRREQYALRPGVWAPWLSLASIAAGKRADAVEYFFKTTPAEAVLARYQRGIV